MNKGGDARVKTQDNRTLVHMAVQNDFHSVVPLLLEKGSDPLVKDNKRKRSAFDDARGPSRGAILAHINKKKIRSLYSGLGDTADNALNMSYMRDYLFNHLTV